MRGRGSLGRVRRLTAGGYGGWIIRRFGRGWCACRSSAASSCRRSVGFCRTVSFIVLAIGIIVILLSFIVVIFQFVLLVEILVVLFFFTLCICICIELLIRLTGIRSF